MKALDTTYVLWRVLILFAIVYPPLSAEAEIRPARYLNLWTGVEPAFGYDSNIYQTPEELQSVEQLQSFFWSIEPFFSLYFKHHKIALSLYYSFNFTDYLDPTAGYSLNHYLKPFFRAFLHQRFYLDLFFRFNDYQISSLPDDNYRVYVGGLQGTILAHRYLHLALTYSFAYRDYHDRGQQDRENKAGLEFSFPLHPVFKFYLAYHYINNQSDIDTLSYHGHEPGVGLVITPLKWLDISADYFIRFRTFSDESDYLNGVSGAMTFTPLKWFFIKVKGSYLNNTGSDPVYNYDKWNLLVSLGFYYDKTWNWTSFKDSFSSEQEGYQIRDRLVTFTLNLTQIKYQGPIRKVALISDFNGWDPQKHEMTCQKKQCQIQIPLSQGTYKYLYLVNGKTIQSPLDVSYLVNDGFGNQCGLVFIP